MPPSQFLTRQKVASDAILPIRNGKPELGWAGDQSLSLAWHQVTNQWELWRHEPERNDPDRHVMLAKGPIGQDLNGEAINLLIRKLVEMDTHRVGNSSEDIVERVLRDNDKAEAARTSAAVEAIQDPLGRFYTEAAKTFGVTKTFFPT